MPAPVALTAREQARSAARAIQQAAKAAKVAKAQDARLRLAVSLYHLAPSFYPTPAKADEGIPHSSEFLDEHIDKTIRLDLFGRPNERAYAAGATFALPDPPRHFTGDVLMARFNEVVAQGPSDGSEWQAPTDDVFIPASEQVSQDLAATDNVVDQKGLAAVRSQFLSSANDNSSNFKPLEARPTLEDDAPAQHHIQTSSSAAVRQGSIDERTARIRDALFGTVGAGEKPGLDVVRKRREARQETIQVQELLGQGEKRQREKPKREKREKREQREREKQQQATEQQAFAEQAKVEQAFEDGAMQAEQSTTQEEIPRTDMPAQQASQEVQQTEAQQTEAQSDTQKQEAEPQQQNPEQTRGSPQSKPKRGRGRGRPTRTDVPT